jgi:DNA-binding NtrC family response regulator
MPQDLPFSRAAAELAAEPNEDVFGIEVAELAYAEAKNKALDAFDVAYLERVMKRAGGNVSEAARQAGMDRSNFRRLLKKVRTKDDDGDDEG